MSSGMDFSTEETIQKGLAAAADMVVTGQITGEQARGIAALADIALLVIRQQNPMKYGYFIWNYQPLYGPYGSTLNPLAYLNPQK